MCMVGKLKRSSVSSAADKCDLSSRLFVQDQYSKRTFLVDSGFLENLQNILNYGILNFLLQMDQKFERMVWLDWN
jgi:hypothetical protein